MMNNFKLNSEKVLEFMKNNPKKTGVIIAGLAFVMAVRSLQKKLIYHPTFDAGFPKSPSGNPKPYRNPTEHGMSSWEQIQLQTEDRVKLRGWHIRYQHDHPKRLVLFFHQNAGSKILVILVDIGTRLPYMRNLVNRTESNVLLIAYRGYSDSEGTPSESGLKKDSVAILRKAVKISEQENLPLFVYGRSLGGAATIYSCSRKQFIEADKKIAGVILQNTFLSIQEVVQDFFKNTVTKILLSPFLYFLVSNKWQSYKLIPKLKMPILFIKSCQDQLIPKRQMDKLQELSSSELTDSFEIVEGTHNETWGLDPIDYFGRFKEFMEKSESNIQK